MDRYFGLESVPRSARFAAAALGTFDGVHLGHRKVVGDALAWAAELGGGLAALTFDRHPLEVVGGDAPPMLANLDHRLDLLSSLGVRATVVLEFTPEFAATPPTTFARRAFAETLRVRGVQLGPDARFGSGAEGTADTLRRLGRELGFEVRVSSPLYYGPEPISSTRIRKAVMAADLAGARAMLGRPFSLVGTVVHGEGRGRRLGYPTANVAIAGEVVPPDGVYIGEAEYAGESFPALVSVGVRPTFPEDPGGRIVEVYMPRFKGDLYGAHLEARFFDRIRDELAFASADELRRQIDRDRRALDAYFATIASAGDASISPATRPPSDDTGPEPEKDDTCRGPA